MEIPNLVRRQLGDEEVEAGVNLGDEDTICLTPSRTLLYRAEGLLSDEKVEEFPHSVERLDVKEGRRKTKFVLEYVEGDRTFTVPKNRTNKVLELLMDGILREADVTSPDEAVTGVFRFSELAIVVTEGRVVKHIGSSVWSEDYEVLPFEDLSELSFERGSVATEVVMTIDGRPQRIKTPNDHARKVQQVIERAVFDYYDVDSLDRLNREIADEVADQSPSDTGRADSSTGSSDIEIGGGIDPLVEDEDVDVDEATTGASESIASETDASAQDRGQHTDTADRTSTQQPSEQQSADSQSSSEREATGSETVAVSETDDADMEAVEAQLDDLTTAVQKQNELLKKQQRTIKQLIEELREGR